MIETYNIDNMNFETEYVANIIYADCIYESKNFNWLFKYWNLLDPNGIFIVQTDWHTNYEYRMLLEQLDGYFVNQLVWKNEWGNHPKNRFHQCYDDIIIYAKSKNWHFNPEVIQVPKVTKTKGLNPSGRETKQATAWIDDICLTTTSLERVKKSDGHLIKWQKPMRLYDRIVAPFLKGNDLILDPFMGSGSLGRWIVGKNLDYIGIELDKDIYKMAVKNIGGE